MLSSHGLLVCCMTLSIKEVLEDCNPTLVQISALPYQLVPHASASCCSDPYLQMTVSYFLGVLSGLLQ